MIGKSTTGGSFRGLANYLEDREKAEWKEAHNLAGDHKNHYVRMMEDTASMSKAEKPVYHLSVSYAPGDNPTKEMMIQDGQEILKKLGLEEHQAVFVGHQDTDHKHFHLMVNRVHPERGKAWNPWQDKQKCKAIFRQIEQARGYEITPEKNWGKGQDLTRGEYKQFAEGGLEKMPLKARAEFYQIDQILKEAKGWEDVRREFANIGLRIKRKGRGGVVEDRASGQTLKLSRVGREYSFGRLEKRFGKLKEFERALAAHKELKKHLPDKEIRTSFAKFARAQNFGSKTLQKSTKEGLKKALSKSWKIGKSVKGLTSLAASSNPMSGAAKLGLKMAKTISKNINRDRGLSR